MPVSPGRRGSSKGGTPLSSADANSFPIVLQFRESVVDAILQAQHRRGVMTHDWTTDVGGLRTRLVLGRPHLALLPSTRQSRGLRSELRFRVLSIVYRPDIGIVVRSEVVEVTVSATTELTSRMNPSPVTGGDGLILSWNADRRDLRRLGTSDSPSRQTEDAILSGWLSSWRSSYPLPPLPGVASLAYWISDAPASGGRLLSVGVGLRESSASRGRLDALVPQEFVRLDWAARLSPEFVASKLAEATAHLTEVRLRFRLQAGAIWVVGELLEDGNDRNSDVDAVFEFGLGLELHGNRVRPSLTSEIDVQLRGGLLGDLLNYISGGRLAAEIRNGVARALDDVIANGLSVDVFSAEILSRFALAEVLDDNLINPTLRDIEVLPDGVCLHGIIDVSDRMGPPVAEFEVQELNDRPGALSPAEPWSALLDGSASWAPGGDPVFFHWDYGDGHTGGGVSSAPALVVSHRYVAGEYLVCLSVTNSSGETSTSCRRVRLGGLDITHVAMPAWRVCRSSHPLSLAFRVYHRGAPVGGATVTLSGGGPDVIGITSADGVVELEVDLSRTRPFPPGSESVALAEGTITVQATKIGYLAASVRRIWVYDCSRREFEPRRVDDLHRTLRRLFRLWKRPIVGDAMHSGRQNRRPPVNEIREAAHALAELEVLANVPQMAAAGVRPRGGERSRTRQPKGAAFRNAVVGNGGGFRSELEDTAVSAARALHDLGLGFLVARSDRAGDSGGVGG